MRNALNLPLRISLVSDFLRKEIAIFLTVAESKSISKAAPELNLQQPAISKALKRLETELKIPLFSRGRDGIKLTQAGRELQASLLKLNEFWKSEHKSEKIKHLTVGCHQSVAIDFFPGLIPDLHRLFPDTEFSFKLLTSLQVTEKVSALEIDLGIVVNPIKRRQIITKPIRQDYVSYWSKVPTEKIPQGTTDSILVHPDMLYVSRIRSTAMEVLQIPDYEVIAAMVKTGPFVGILPSSVALRHSLQQIDKKLFTVDLSIIFHEDRFDRDTAKKILKLFN
jgi:DNA-binding transcriptional LysR family regulator